MKVAGLDVRCCDAGWRNYYFLKLSTDQGVRQIGAEARERGFTR